MCGCFGDPMAGGSVVWPALTAMVLVLLVLAGTGALVWCGLSRGPRQVSARSTPEEPGVEVLKNRYARGEIDHEEFEQRLHHLLASSGHGDSRPATKRHG